MASMFGQSRHSAQSSLREAGEFRDGEISKLAGDLARIQQKAEIGGRNTSGDCGRLFLHIIGDQPVMLFGTEFRKISPNVQGRATKKEHVLAWKFIAAGRGFVEPKSNQFAA